MWDKLERRKALVAELFAWALRKGQSRAQLAQRFGVSRSSVTRWFSGRRVPTPAMARKLALLVPAAERETGDVVRSARDKARALKSLEAAHVLRELLQPHFSCEVRADDHVRMIIDVTKDTAFCLEFDQEDPLLVCVLGKQSRLHAVFRVGKSTAPKLLACINGFNTYGQPPPPSTFEKVQRQTTKALNRVQKNL